MLRFNSSIKKYFNESGQLHRVGGPALITPNGKEYFYLNGKPFEKDSLLYKLECIHILRKNKKEQK